MSYFNKNKWWAIGILLLVVINIATLTTLWVLKDGPPPKGRDGGAENFLIKELGLDSLQQIKLFELRRQHEQTVQEIRRSDRGAREALFDLLQKTNVSDSLLNQAAYKVSAFDAQIQMATFHHFQRVRDLCRDDQKEKFAEILQQVLRMMGPKPPGRGENGHPPSGENGPPPGGENGPPPPRDNERQE